MMASKRPRSSSRSSSPSSSSPPSSPSLKLVKVIPDVLFTSLACTLPPTCSFPRKATQLSSAHDVEDHYAKYHTHVCEEKGCKTVFPDARLLELHFSECHDPIIALKKEKGEKTFACYVASCPRLFLAPKGRRLHLIQAHGYPKQYFFSVTNKGIGGLLQKWGPGASLYRGDWRPRVQDQTMKSGSDSANDSDSDSPRDMDVEDIRSGMLEVNGRQIPPHMDAVFPSIHSPDSPPAQPHLHSEGSSEPDTLATAMSSLTLVPDKIRFGRGGKKGGFVHSQHVRTSKTSRDVHLDKPVNTNSNDEKGKPAASRGRGGRRRNNRRPSHGASSTSGPGS